MNRLLSLLMPWALLALGLNTAPTSSTETSRPASAQIRSGHPGAQHALLPSLTELRPAPPGAPNPTDFGMPPTRTLLLGSVGTVFSLLLPPVSASDFSLRKAHRARSPPRLLVG